MGGPPIVIVTLAGWSVYTSSTTWAAALTKDTLSSRQAYRTLEFGCENFGSPRAALDWVLLLLLLLDIPSSCNDWRVEEGLF